MTMTKKYTAAHEAFLRANAGLAEHLQVDSAIAKDLARKFERTPYLTPKQVDLARAIAMQSKREAEEVGKLRPVPITDERVTVEGIIISTKTVESYGQTNVKMLVRVEHEGQFYKIWGTAPESFWFNSEGFARELPGCRVRFNARLKASGKDPNFGFFTRPTKAEITQEVQTND